MEEFHGVTRSLHDGRFIGCLAARLDSGRSLVHHYGLTPDGLTFPRHHRSHLVRHLSRRGTVLRRFYNRHRFCAYQTSCLIAILKRIDRQLHWGHANQQYLVAVNPSISNVHRCCDASLARFRGLWTRPLCHCFAVSCFSISLSVSGVPGRWDSPVRIIFASATSPLHEVAMPVVVGRANSGAVRCEEMVGHHVKMNSPAIGDTVRFR